MQEIIDVEYRELTVLEEKSTEELASEANSLWEQSEMVAAISLKLLAQAGERLMVIKGRLQHGQWEDWCAENLKFSKSKAEKVMLFASKVSDKNSIFAKTETFTDIGISKVYALLSASEEVAKTMVENPEAKDMSVREFKDEIKRLKEEAEGHRKKEAEDADRIDALDHELQKAKDDVNALELQLMSAKESKKDEAELEKIKGKLDEANKKLAAEKEARKKDKEKTDSVVEAAKAEAEEKARARFEAEARNREDMLKMKYEDAMRSVESLEKKLANNSQEDVAVFKVNADRLQSDFNACMKSVEKIRAIDQAQAEKMKDALRQVMEMLVGRI